MEWRDLGGVKATNPSDTARSKGLVCGIFGLPFVGKTTLLEDLLTDEETYPVAAFNFDGGAHVLRDVPDKLAVYTPDGWNQMDAALEDIMKDPHPFKSLWFDVVTDLQDVNIDHYGIYDLGTGDARQRQIRFGASNWDVVRFHRKMMDDVAERHGVNVFFVYWSTRPQEKEGEPVKVSKRYILLSPTVSLKVAGMLDFNIYVESQTDLRFPYPPNVICDGRTDLETKWRVSPDNPLKKWRGTQQNFRLSEMVRAFHGEVFPERCNP